MKTWQVSNSTFLMTLIRNFIDLERKKERKSVKAKPFASWQNGFSSTKLPETHDYTKHKSGIDYFFDIAHPTNTAIMTGKGMGIKPKDYFLLSIDGQICKYQVQEVDYYCKPSDAWIVSLKYIE